MARVDIEILLGVHYYRCNRIFARYERNLFVRTRARKIDRVSWKLSTEHARENRQRVALFVRELPT